MAGVACVNQMYVAGPYNNADPLGRIQIGDVKRRYDCGSDKTFLNGVKTMTAHEVLHSAGLHTPDTKFFLPKSQKTGTATASVALGSNGIYRAMAFNLNTPGHPGLASSDAAGVSATSGLGMNGSVVLDLPGGTKLMQKTSTTTAKTGVAPTYNPPKLGYKF